MTTVSKLKPGPSAPESGRRQKSRELTNAQANKLYKQFVASAAPLNRKQMQAIEANISSFDVTRRIGLTVLTRSGKELRDACKDRQGAGALAEAHTGLLNYHHNLTKLTELIETAGLRLAMASWVNVRAGKAFDAAQHSPERTETVDFTQMAN